MPRYTGEGYFDRRWRVFFGEKHFEVFKGFYKLLCDEEGELFEFIHTVLVAARQNFSRVLITV